MKILIVEDEPLVAMSLAKLVKELEPAAELLGPIATVKEAREWFLANPQPDLVLSDIQLSDGISLDIFSADFPSCPIIFTTAYNEYAIRAFKLNSIDYLLKPIDKIELQTAFQKYHLLQSKFSNENYIRQIAEVFKNFSELKKYKERFAVHQGRTVTLVPSNEICFFVKEELIYLVNAESKKFITDYRSLDEISELVDPSQFYRANRQYLVHLKSIEGFRTDESGRITLKIKNNKSEEIIISKEKAAEFRKWFEG
ncbi:MAG: DNA-binding response regulator [Bacteroidetes bacterium]|nr:MAG: DNA-binding response regulator [Bacteroidota bacterium]